MFTTIYTILYIHIHIFPKIPHFYIHWFSKKTYKRGDISQKPKGLKGGETLPLLIGFQME